MRQEHNSSGDNVAGNKLEENNYYSADSSDNSITSKISSLEQHNKLDFTNDIVIKAFKESLVELIKAEQDKSHSIVPIGHIRNKYKNYIEDILFEKTIKDLKSENSIEVNSVQVCYVPKDLGYTIEI